MRILSTLTLLCFVAAACAHNPARPITPNDEEVQVHEELMTPELDYGDSTAGDGEGKPPRVQPVFFTRANAGLDAAIDRQHQHLSWSCLRDVPPDCENHECSEERFHRFLILSRICAASAAFGETDKYFWKAVLAGPHSPSFSCARPRARHAAP